MVADLFTVGIPGTPAVVDEGAIEALPDQLVMLARLLCCCRLILKSIILQYKQSISLWLPTHLTRLRYLFLYN